jgi:hypothetical protein
MISRGLALACYAAAVGVMAAGTLLAARRYPQGFDWVYTVISALASRKHNPEGGHYFAAALSLAMLCLWPVLRHLRATSPPGDRTARFGLAALRLGLICLGLVGLERLFVHHLSDLIHKAHELLALVGFLGLYCGVLALFRSRIRIQPGALWPALAVVLPLLAVGLSQGALYLDQRDLGWVNAGWRERGIHFAYSFAFWQWIAAAMLWVGIGHLIWISRSPYGELRDEPD